jgi:multidrug resistance efflux pump
MAIANVLKHSLRNRAGYSRRALILGLGLAVVVVLSSLALFRGGDTMSNRTTVAARRGPLEISVLVGGSVAAQNSQRLVCEVESWTGGRKILKIVDEGRLITQEDIDNNLVLVELDAADLQRELTTTEITFQGTEASLTESQQAYEIQVNQSSSEIFGVELELTFAQLEMEKYLGISIASDLIAQLEKEEVDWDFDLDDEEPTLPAKPVEGGTLSQVLIDSAGNSGAAPSPAAQPAATLSSATDGSSEKTLTVLRRNRPTVDFAQYADSALLGSGDANQKIRQLEDALIVAQRTMGQAKVRLSGTERLHEKGFVTELELENDRMDYEKNVISVESAKTAQQLFKQYEFPKQGQQLYANYIQAQAKLVRTEKKALSDIAKARAQRRASEVQYRIETEQITKLRNNIAKCVMRATAPGLVVYGSGENEWWEREPIREGATMREQQTIITIPDTRKMSAKVKIQETEITKVAVGQDVRVTIGAFADQELTGTVTRVAVLPSSEDEFLNPDLKVYETVIEILGSHDWLKPGMSAELEIISEKLDDVIYIPIQSVVPQGSAEVCFVLGPNGPEPREIETGATTVECIVVHNGLKEGEQVLLRAPDGSREDESDEEVRDDEDFDEERLLRGPEGIGQEDEYSEEAYDDDGRMK